MTNFYYVPAGIIISILLFIIILSITNFFKKKILVREVFDSRDKKIKLLENNIYIPESQKIIIDESNYLTCAKNVDLLLYCKKNSEKTYYDNILICSRTVNLNLIKKGDLIIIELNNNLYIREVEDVNDNYFILKIINSKTTEEELYSLNNIKNILFGIVLYKINFDRKKYA